MEVLEAGAVFWILSVVIIVSGMLVVSLKNIFHCALALVVCLFAVAGIYLLLEAEFLAAANNGIVDCSVEGRLTTGECVYGDDVVRIIQPRRRRVRNR